MRHPACSPNEKRAAITARSTLQPRHRLDSRTHRLGLSPLSSRFRSGLRPPPPTQAPAQARGDVAQVEVRLSSRLATFAQHMLSGRSGSACRLSGELSHAAQAGRDL